jgi:osmotically-inducible protein OsmY
MKTRTLLLPLFLAMMFFAPAALAGEEAVNLTDVFIAGGVTIDRLLVYQTAEILLISGRTDDPALAAEATRFAVSRGYRRVANLIQIVPAIGDEGIERLARYQLETARALAGCSFGVESVGGIVRIWGVVVVEAQKHAATRMVERLDGVSRVNSSLTVKPLKGNRDSGD